MKKSLKIILPIVGCLLILLSIVLIRSCANNEYRNLDISFGKKYYAMSSVNNSTEGDYYLFYANGSGEYKTGETKINFKYTVIEDNTIVCFYHSIEGAASPTPSWYREFTVSKNVIKYTTSTMYGDGAYYYINEAYISKIPNFDY